MDISGRIVLFAVAVVVAAGLLWLIGSLYTSQQPTWTRSRLTLSNALSHIRSLTNQYTIQPLWGGVRQLVGDWSTHKWGVVVGVTIVLVSASVADFFLLENYFADRLQQAPLVHQTAAGAILMISMLPGIVLDAGGFSVYRRLTEKRLTEEQKLPEAVDSGDRRTSTVIVIGIIFQLVVLIGLLFLADDRVSLLHNQNLHPDSGTAARAETLAWILLFAALSLALSLLHGVGFDLANLVMAAVLVLASVVSIVAFAVVGGILGLTWLVMSLAGWLFTVLAEMGFALSFPKRPR